MKKYSIALVGCGRWGKFILRDLISLGCDVHVVARSKESIQRAREGGATSIVDSIEKLPKVDGAVNASLTMAHAEVTEQLLKLQVPIFIEKPFTDDSKSAKNLIQLGGDRIFIMDKWRYHPGIEALGDIAKTEVLGKVIGVKTKIYNWGNSQVDRDCIWIFAPHTLTIILEILGHLPSPEYATVDLVKDEIMGMTAALGCAPWAWMEISIRSYERVRSTILHCEEGIAILDDPYAPFLHIIRNSSSDPVIEKWPISTEFPLLRELKAFLGYIDGGLPPKSSSQEGMLVVQTIERLKELSGLPQLIG